jgi:hypothetical protein
MGGVSEPGRAKLLGNTRCTNSPYSEARQRLELPAQIVVRGISKVADAYQLDQQRTFRPLGSLAFDDRNLRWHVDQKIVSLGTLGGIRDCVVPLRLLSTSGGCGYQRCIQSPLEGAPSTRRTSSACLEQAGQASGFQPIVVDCSVLNVTPG